MTAQTYLIDGVRYSENDYLDGDQFHPLDEILVEEKTLSRDAVYLSVKWSPKSGVYRPDGKRLRGKFRVKDITQLSDGTYVVILLNGVGVKLNPNIPLNRQGYRFRIQHTEPVGITQAYNYLHRNEIEEEVQNMKTKPVYLESVDEGNRITSIDLTDSGYLQLVLESGRVVLVDPDKELLAQNYVFVRKNTSKINLLETVLEFFDLPLVETLAGYEIDQAYLTEDINEAGAIQWAKDKLNDVGDWFRDRRARKETKLGKQESINIARSIWYGWAKFAGATGLDATPSNLMNYLKRAGLSQKLISYVAKTATSQFGQTFPELDTPVPQSSLSDELDNLTPENPATPEQPTPEQPMAQPSASSGNYAQELQAVRNRWLNAGIDKDFVKFTRATGDDKEQLRLKMLKDVEPIMTSYLGIKQSYVDSVKSGKMKEDPALDKTFNQFDTWLRRTDSQLNREQVAEAEDEAETPLDKKKLRDFFLTVVRTSVANNIALPRAFVNSSTVSSVVFDPEAPQQQGYRQAPSYQQAPEPSYGGGGGSRAQPTQSTRSARQQRNEPAVLTSNIVNQVIEDAVRIGRVEKKNVLRIEATVHDPAMLDSAKSNIGGQEIRSLAKLGWGLIALSRRVQ